MKSKLVNCKDILRWLLFCFASIIWKRKPKTMVQLVFGIFFLPNVLYIVEHTHHLNLDCLFCKENEKKKKKMGQNLIN